MESSSFDTTEVIGEAAPNVDESRCLRYRWIENSCTRCSDACPSDAVSIGDQEVRIEASSCSVCMRCIPTCPVGAIEGNEQPFEEIVRKASVPGVPVVGCRRAGDSPAHVRLVCLGYLSGEILLALAISFDGPLQLNAVKCNECPRGSVIEELKKELFELGQSLPREAYADISLVEDPRDLRYEALRVTRRGFFGQLNTGLKSRVQQIIETLESTESATYRTKRVPKGRSALNAAVESLDRDVRAQVVGCMRVTASITDACNECAMCVALCPTGALRMNRKDGSADRSLAFSPPLCTSCGLCVEACPQVAISVDIAGTTPLVAG